MICSIYRGEFIMCIKNLVLTFALLCFASTSFASATRHEFADDLTTSNGFVLTIPGVTDTLVGLAATQTLTNKSISGAANTFSLIPVSAIATGTGLGVPSGGTGGVSFTSNGILFGAGTSALSVTAAGSQFQVLQAGSGGTPQFAALNLSQSAAITGTLPLASGGTGQTSASAAINALVPSQTSNSGDFLTTNGTSVSWAAIPSVGPVLNGTSASPQSVTAAGGISLSGITYSNVAFITGSGSAQTVTATPSITACTADGQSLKLIGTSASNTVTLQDQSNLASSGLSLNGNFIASKDSVIGLHCDITQGLWIEDFRR
jgi:hypothetical protein